MIHDHGSDPSLTLGMGKQVCLVRDRLSDERIARSRKYFRAAKTPATYFLLAVDAASVLMMVCTTFPAQFILFPSTQHIEPHGVARDTLPVHTGELDRW